LVGNLDRNHYGGREFVYCARRILSVRSVAMSTIRHFINTFFFLIYLNDASSQKGLPIHSSHESASQTLYHMNDRPTRASICPLAHYSSQSTFHNIFQSLIPLLPPLIQLLEPPPCHSGIAIPINRIDQAHIPRTNQKAFPVLLELVIAQAILLPNIAV
jgi:hypothetical protein